MTDLDITEVKFFVVNLKLISISETSTERYYDLVNSLLEKSPITRTTKGIIGVIKKYAKVNTTTGKIFVGEITKAKVVEDLYVFDENDQLVKEEGSEPRYSDPRDARFVFVPHAHRFAFIESDSVSTSWFVSFLRKAIKTTLGEGEKIELTIQSSTDFITKYLTGDSIRKIKIQTSYSNSDSFDSAAMRAIEANMKKTHTRTIKIEAQSDETGGIDILDNNILNPLAGQALSNGEISAWSMDNHETEPDITTKTTPQEYTIQRSDSSNEGIEIFRKIMSIFRPES